MVTERSDYAVRALVEMASRSPMTPVTADEIAEAQAIPRRFLTRLLGDLRVAGLIRSHRGYDGGFTFRRAPDAITVADVVRAVEGPLTIVEEGRPEDPAEASAPPGPGRTLDLVWAAAAADLRAVLEQVTLADLARRRRPPGVEAPGHRSDPASVVRPEPTADQTLVIGSGMVIDVPTPARARSGRRT